MKGKKVDSMQLIFFGIVVILFINYQIANQFYEIAEMKGFQERKYFWIAFLLGIVGYLLVIALPDKNQRQIQVTMAAADRLSEQTPEFESDELPDL